MISTMVFVLLYIWWSSTSCGQLVLIYRIPSFMKTMYAILRLPDCVAKGIGKILVNIVDEFVTCRWTVIHQQIDLWHSVNIRWKDTKIKAQFVVSKSVWKCPLDIQWKWIKEFYFYFINKAEIHRPCPLKSHDNERVVIMHVEVFWQQIKKQDTFWDLTTRYSRLI